MPRRHTLLLVFIHGFKGDDDTFRDFPRHLASLVAASRPNLQIHTAVYPRYETRGELPAAVAQFREWLTNTVIDLEVSLGTPSPTIDPSVHTILIGHSMGGIVAADTVLSILDDEPISDKHQLSQPFSKEERDPRLLFPHIVGVLAFDTPYLGLAPALFAHAAEDKYTKASNVFGTVSTLASSFFATKTAEQGLVPAGKPQEQKRAENTGGEWNKLLAVGGAAAALVGVGAVGYAHRDTLTSGMSWVTSHLSFVSALMKGEELQSRADRISSIPNMGFANCFTSLGSKLSTNGYWKGKERTFCIVPAEYTRLRKMWCRCVNESVPDEVGAHVAMFSPSTNPGFTELGERARGCITAWVGPDQWPVREEIEYEGFEAYDRMRRSHTGDKERRSSKSHHHKDRDETREERRERKEREKLSRHDSSSKSSHRSKEEKESRRSSRAGSVDFGDERIRSERKKNSRHGSVVEFEGGSRSGTGSPRLPESGETKEERRARKEREKAMGKMKRAETWA